jgi:hypothetical protein
MDDCPLYFWTSGTLAWRFTGTNTKFVHFVLVPTIGTRVGSLRERSEWARLSAEPFVHSPNAPDTERNDIVAKVPAGATKVQVNVMWQNLLKERLGMVLHHESKDFPVDELTLAKGGSKLKETEDPNIEPITPKRFRPRTNCWSAYAPGARSVSLAFVGSSDPAPVLSEPLASRAHNPRRKPARG